MGKVEGEVEKEEWHGHVTAVTVGPEFRRIGLARKLMSHLEYVSEKVHNGFFVDLFVRMSNVVAIEMYKSFGYSDFRRVLMYYMGEEDAMDMRIPLARDVHRRSIIAKKKVIRPEELEW